MRGIIEANVNLSGLARGEQAEVELDDRVLNRASKGLIRIVSSEPEPEPEGTPDDGQGEGNDEGEPGSDEGTAVWTDL